MSADRFRRQVEFLQEIDKLKSILRRNLLMDGTRRENDAEHSWHLVMMAIIMGDHLRSVDYDLLKVIKMVAIHDIVEIYAGDVFAYDVEGLASKLENEKRAAEKIFGRLPRDQKEELIALWEEFEEGLTMEARIAGVYDRFQPELNNYATQGSVWKDHKVTPDRILDRNRGTADTFPAIWQHIQDIVKDSIDKKFILEEY